MADQGHGLPGAVPPHVSRLAELLINPADLAHAHRIMADIIAQRADPGLDDGGDGDENGIDDNENGEDLEQHFHHRPVPVRLVTDAPTNSERPTEFLLSLRVGDEVDAMDEIGYRQWRHAFVLELGHIPGQRVTDSGRIGEYKIRWSGWDAKWDEWVHGSRLAPLNSQVLGDTGPECVSETDSASRIGREWKQVRVRGTLTDIALTFPKAINGARCKSESQPSHSRSGHNRSLSDELKPPFVMMPVHLPLLSVRCPSMMAMFIEAQQKALTGTSGSEPLVTFHPRPDGDVEPQMVASSSDNDSNGGHSVRSVSSAQGFHRDSHLHGPIPSSLFASPQSSRMPAHHHIQQQRPSTASAAVARLSTPNPPTHSRNHNSISGIPDSHPAFNSRSASAQSAQAAQPSRQPSARRSLNFTPTNDDTDSHPFRLEQAVRAQRAANAQRLSHSLAPHSSMTPLSRSTPVSPMQGTSSLHSHSNGNVPPMTPRHDASAAKLSAASRERASDDDSMSVEEDVRATVRAMSEAIEFTHAVAMDDSIPADYGSDENNNDSSGFLYYEQKEREEKTEILDDDSDDSSVSSSIIPVFAVPGIRSYAALRAFVEFLYTDSFDPSASAKIARTLSNSQSSNPNASPSSRPLTAPLHGRVGVGVGVGGDDDNSDNDNLTMLPVIDPANEERLNQRIVQRTRNQVLREQQETLNSITSTNANTEGTAKVSTGSPNCCLSMSDLFDLCCVGSRFHFPRLIALCAAQLSDELTVDNIMQALQLCVAVGCLGDSDDALKNIYESSSSATFLPSSSPNSAAPPSALSLTEHKPTDLSLMLRIAFDFLAYHWDNVMKKDTSVKILHTLPFAAFSAVVQVKGKSHNGGRHGADVRYTPPLVHQPASRLVRDCKQLFLQRGPPPTNSESQSVSPSSASPLALAHTHCPCDVKIIVGNHTHWAHRCVLAARSDYFRALFASSMSDSQCVEFPTSMQSTESIDALLRYLYYDDVTTISYEAALFLFSTATDFFGLANDQLEKACEKLIMDSCSGDSTGGGERRIGLMDVCRMSFKLSKWALFERAVRFIDWNGLASLLKPRPSTSQSSKVLDDSKDEKQNDDDDSGNGSAGESDVDMELVRAIVNEKAAPGSTMRSHGLTSAITTATASAATASTASMGSAARPRLSTSNIGPFVIERGNNVGTSMRNDLTIEGIGLNRLRGHGSRAATRPASLQHVPIVHDLGDDDDNDDLDNIHHGDDHGDNDADDVELLDDSIADGNDDDDVNEQIARLLVQHSQQMRRMR